MPCRFLFRTGIAVDFRSKVDYGRQRRGRIDKQKYIPDLDMLHIMK